jgi:hypothetical protein
MNGSAMIQSAGRFVRWCSEAVQPLTEGEDEVMDGVVAAPVSRKLRLMRWMESADAEVVAGAGVGEKTETNSVI